MITLLIIGLGALLLISFANSDDVEVIEYSEPTATTPNVGTVTTRGRKTTVVSRHGAKTPINNIQQRSDSSVYRDIVSYKEVTTDPVSKLSDVNMANVSPPTETELRRPAAVAPVPAEPVSVSLISRRVSVPLLGR